MTDWEIAILVIGLSLVAIFIISDIIHIFLGHSRVRGKGTSVLFWNISLWEEYKEHKYLKNMGISNKDISSLIGQFISWENEIYRVVGQGYNKTLGRHVSTYNLKGRLKINETVALENISKERFIPDWECFTLKEKTEILKIKELYLGPDHRNSFCFYKNKLHYWIPEENRFKNVSELSAKTPMEIEAFKKYREIQMRVYNFEN